MKPAGSFGQYLEIYKAHGVDTGTLLSELNARCAEALPDVIDAWRPEADALEQSRPDTLFAPDYGINFNRVDMPADVAASFRCGVPQLNSLLAVVVNDIFHPTQSLLKNIPDGLCVCSLRSVPADFAADAAHMLSDARTLASPQALINGLLLHDGVYIRAERNVDVEKAVQIVNIFNSPVPMLTPRRVLIHAMEGAKLRVLLCDHSQAADTDHLNSQIVQVIAERGSTVELYDIEESSPRTRRNCIVTASLADGASLTANGNFLHGGTSRNEYVITIGGDDASVNLSGLGICSDEEVLDNRVRLIHSGKRGTSRQLFKNALSGNSCGQFGGIILVEEGACHTDAAQTNRNILVSETARMMAAPQLEIYCDDVKCSHGATTGQLDERALFYMQTRGIPADEARKMLTQAFMADVVDNISFEVLRQRMHMLVEKRLTGSEGQCDTCAACRPNEDSDL